MSGILSWQRSVENTLIAPDSDLRIAPNSETKGMGGWSQEGRVPSFNYATAGDAGIPRLLAGCPRSVLVRLLGDCLLTGSGIRAF